MSKELNLNLEKSLFSAISNMNQSRVSKRVVGDPSVYTEVVLILHANGETGYKAVVEKSHYSKNMNTVLKRNL